MVKDIHQTLEDRKWQFIGWLIACGALILVGLFIGSMRAEWYSDGENTFLTIVMILMILIGIVAGIVASVHGKSYEELRQTIAGNHKGRQ